MVVKLYILICIIGGLNLGCQPKVMPKILLTPTRVPPNPTKQVVLTDLPLVEKWRWSGQTFDSIIIARENLIILANNSWDRDEITIFDASSGSVIWQGKSIKGIRSIYADDEYIYLGLIQSVQAYNLDTGDMIWETIPKPENNKGGLYVYSNQERLEVYDPYNGYLFTLGVKTGKILEEIQQTLPFFQWKNIYISGNCGPPKMTCLNAIDLHTDKLIWSHSFQEGVYRWPLIIDNTIFLNTKEEAASISIYSGDFLWYSTGNNFVTPMVTDGRLLYVMSDNAQITGIDPGSGNQVGVVEVNPAQTPVTNKGGFTTFYTLAASKQYVVAYYGDSQELIVFEIVDKHE